MIPVPEALERILTRLHPVDSETVPVVEAFGRVLTKDVAACLTHPPAAISAMDGYAVRGEDIATAPADLRLVGEAPAGGAYDEMVGPGQAVRIFTGGILPIGTNTVVIQENTNAFDGTVRVLESTPIAKNVRAQGLDFAKGDIPLAAGRRLTARDVGLAAAMGLSTLKIRRRPRVAILCTGNELVPPGEMPGPNQIINSNGVSLAAVVAGAGGKPVDLGIALDDAESLLRAAASSAGADLLVTVGGASVGNHDLVQSVLKKSGLEVDFWKVALRPGKPLISGILNGLPMLGLPGNPVSALVCALLFVRPALEALLGIPNPSDGRITAELGRDLKANDQREDYVRSALERRENGTLVATPFELQDSSQLSTLARADCLAIRQPNAAAARTGDCIDVVPFTLGLDGY